MNRTLLLTLLLLTAACDGATRDPTGLGGHPGGGLTGGGNGGGGSGGSLLVGSWQVDLVYQLSNDVQRHTITWTFGADNSCSRRVEIYSVLEDRTLTTTAGCTFIAGSGEVLVTYEGRSSPVTFQWSVANFSRDHLVLDGITYDRIA
jgi:hypothetical protein